MGAPFLYSAFNGGLNTLNAPDLLEDSESRDLLNVQGTTAGAIVKRAGLVTLASPSNVFTSLYGLVAGASVLIGADATNIYSVDTSGTVTSIASGLSNHPWAFTSAPVVSAQGPLFGMNGTDTPRQWSGAGAAANWTNASGAVAVPNGTYMLYHQNQMFVSGVGSNPSRLYWSAIANPTNWDPASITGAGSMDFDPNDGDVITGIGVVGPYVLVCKRRKLWILVDPATATVRKLSDDIGCVSHRSIAGGPEGVFFLSEDRGVYTTNGSKLQPISDKIQPTIDSILPSLRPQTAGAYFNAHYYLSVPLGGSSNDTVLDYDLKLGSWWKHSFGSNQFAVWHSGAVSTIRPPSVGADDGASAGAGTTAWANPGNVTVEDGTSALAGGASYTTHYLKATGFGFAIPSTATITGIKVDVKKFATGTGVKDYRARVYKAGTIQTAVDHADTVTNWLTSLGFVGYGGASDLWGVAWTPADINNSGFGFGFASQGTIHQSLVDFIQITVYYSLPVTDSQLYSAKATSAKVDHCFVPNVYTDNGSAMTWVWRGPWQSPTFYRRRRFPTPYFRKRLRQVRLDGYGTVDLSYAMDYAASETLLKANALTEGTGTVRRGRVLGGLGVANAFSMVFGSTSSSSDAIFSYTLMVTDRRDSIPG